jgi:hypothetical protein
MSKRERHRALPHFFLCAMLEAARPSVLHPFAFFLAKAWDSTNLNESIPKGFPAG